MHALRLLAIATLLAVLTAGCTWPAAEPEGHEAAIGLICTAGGPPDGCNQRLEGTRVNEFAVAANPLDPDNAIVVGNDYGAGDADGSVPGAEHRLWGSWWKTHDGGVTWVKQTLSGRFLDTGSSLWGADFVGDLVVAFAPDGTAYLAGIGYRTIGPLSDHVLFVAASHDGGRTFADPVLVDSSNTEVVFHDKPALHVRPDGSLVVVWSFRENVPGQRGLDEQPGHMRIAFSQDHGATWQADAFSHEDGGISATIAESPDGALHVAWRTYNPLAIQYTVSRDDGATWAAPTPVFNLESGDVTTPNAPYRTFVLPDMTATPDGAVHIIATPRHDNGSSPGVLVASTTDHGATWSTHRIDGANDAADRFLPAITTDADGGLVAAWLDRRHDPENGAYQFWMATRGPDGIPWREGPVAAAESPPDAAATFIGDYLDIAVSSDRVYAAWPDLRDDGSSTLYVAALRTA